MPIGGEAKRMNIKGRWGGDWVAIMPDHLGEGVDDRRDGFGWHLSEERQGDVQTLRSDPTDIPTSVGRA